MGNRIRKFAENASQTKETGSRQRFAMSGNPCQTLVISGWKVKGSRVQIPPTRPESRGITTIPRLLFFIRRTNVRQPCDTAYISTSELPCGVWGCEAERPGHASIPCSGPSVGFARGLGHSPYRRHTNTAPNPRRETRQPTGARTVINAIPLPALGRPSIIGIDGACTTGCG